MLRVDLPDVPGEGGRHAGVEPGGPGEADPAAHGEVADGGVGREDVAVGGEALRGRRAGVGVEGDHLVDGRLEGAAVELQHPGVAVARRSATQRDAAWLSRKRAWTQAWFRSPLQVPLLRCSRSTRGWCEVRGAPSRPPGSSGPRGWRPHAR